MNSIFAIFHSNVERLNEIIIIIGYELLASTESHHVPNYRSPSERQQRLFFLRFHLISLHTLENAEAWNTKTTKYANFKWIPSDEQQLLQCTWFIEKSYSVCLAHEKFNSYQKLFQGALVYELRIQKWRLNYMRN